MIRGTQPVYGNIILVKGLGNIVQDNIESSVSPVQQGLEEKSHRGRRNQVRQKIDNPEKREPLHLVLHVGKDNGQKEGQAQLQDDVHSPDPDRIPQRPPEKLVRKYPGVVGKSDEMRRPHYLQIGKGKVEGPEDRIHGKNQEDDGEGSHKGIAPPVVPAEPAGFLGLHYYPL